MKAIALFSCFLVFLDTLLGIGAISRLFRHAPTQVTGRIPLQPKSTCTDWIAWTPPLRRPAVIVQVVTNDYIEIERNFIEQMETNSNFVRYHLYALCMDAESVEATKLMGFQCVPVINWPRNNSSDVDTWKSYSLIWILRTRALSCLLEFGHDVIVSDSDALWMHNPMKDFNLPDVRQSSIVASRGSFPFELGKQWGTTLSMGFAFFRSSASMLVYVRLVQRLVLDTGDDQKALNNAASELGIVWDKRSDMRYEESTEFGRGTIQNVAGNGFNVTLLPHNRYTRRCSKPLLTHEIVVVHCSTPKDWEAKVSWMKKAGLWKVYYGIG